MRHLDDILRGTAARNHVEIINSTAAIGKWTLLEYVLARMRGSKKSDLFQEELMLYATNVGIPNAKHMMQENMLRLGGVSRYAFTPGAAEDAANVAISGAEAKELY